MLTGARGRLRHGPKCKLSLVAGGAAMLGCKPLLQAVHTLAPHSAFFQSVGQTLRTISRHGARHPASRRHPRRRRRCGALTRSRRQGGDFFHLCNRCAKRNRCTLEKAFCEPRVAQFEYVQLRHDSRAGFDLDEAEIGRRGARARRWVYRALARDGHPSRRPVHRLAANARRAVCRL